jgi:hypothetical protein
MSKCRLLLATLIWQTLTPAWAGQTCETKEVAPTTVALAMDLAWQTRQALDSSGAQVALIARVGQDLSKYGLRYSHMAWVWRDHPQGRWLVVHKLNNCATADSALYNEGLGNFFLDDMFAFETKIMIPSAQTQARAVAWLNSPNAAALHSAKYNMLAFPYSTVYQNSNQWVLETYAAMYNNETGRSAAQSWLKANGYQPITIYIPTATRLGARMFRANVAFDDHPVGRRLAGQIDTVTVESVLRFIKQREPDSHEIVLRANPIR